MKNILNDLITKENLMENFVFDVKQKKLPIALFGCGNALQYALKFLDLNGFQAEVLIDNDTEIVGTFRNGLVIHDFYSFINIPKKHIVLVVPQDMSSIIKIKNQLATRVCDDEIYSFDFINYMIYYNIQSEKSFKDFVIKNVDSLAWLFDKLEDQVSKQTLIAYLSGKITSDYQYYQDIFVGDNYFVDEIVALNDNEVFVDCGAFKGDTIQNFIQKVGSYEKIFAFEADESNFHQLQLFIRNFDLQNISIFYGAVWNEKTTIYFDATEDTLSRVSSSGMSALETFAIDDVITCPVTFIKMDIEGSEYEALQGARTVIKKFKPKLAVCVYHKYEDLIRIPHLINNFEPGYKFFLRHHSPCGAELILYAIPN